MDMVDPLESMPLLKLLAFQSPEIIDPEKIIEGTKPGDIIFSPTGEILEQPIEFAVIAKTTIYAEWRPKSDGGGLVGHHPQTIVGDPGYKKGSDKSKWDEFLITDGQTNELKLTMYYMIKFLKDELENEWIEGILAFSKTGLSAVGRPLNKMISKFTYSEEFLTKFKDANPFLFSQSYHLSSFLDKDDKNQWYNWKVEPGRVFDLEYDKDFLEDCLDTQQIAIKALPTPSNNPSVTQPALTDSEAVDPNEIF